MRAIINILCGTALCLATTLDAATPAAPKHLFQAEILFEVQRGHAFDALLKLNSGLAHETSRINSDTINKNDLLLAFGLSKQVEKNIKAADNNNPQQRNHSAYLLAKFYDENQQPVKTIQALEMIHGNISQQDKLPLQQLTALAYIRTGKYNAAADLLEKLAADNDSNVYIQYNLALAQLQSGNEKKGLSTLASLGQITGYDAEQLSVKDLANLQLGDRYLNKAQPAQAKIYYNRVRMDSPFIEQTLLGSGWADFSLGKFERAVVPWSMLHNSKELSDSVIEAKMALPYAYAKLGAHGKAANLYGQTIETLEAELSRINTAIKHAQNGELQQHLINAFEAQPNKAYPQLAAENRKQPFYLHTLLTDPQFRLLANMLHELVLSKNRLHQQQQSIDAFNELIRLKQKHYTATKVKTQKAILKIAQKIKDIEVSAAKLANSSNKTNLSNTISPLKSKYKNYLQLQKNQASDYQQLGNHKKQLVKLSKQLKQLNNKLNPVFTRAGKQLSLLATNKLKQQHSKLENYRVNALFALAESYDFATRKQQ